MKKHFFVATATIMSSLHFAQAQDSSFTKQLDEVVITANKYPQKLSSTGKVLTVIGREQLENNIGRTLAQVLNEQAGIIVNGAQNTLGSNLTVYMRGAAGANTLILIDGIPANDPSGTSGEFDINYLAIDQIDRVEILKGAQSVLYGSDAVAGVINIITKKGAGKKPFAANATLAGGSYGTAKGTLGIHGQTKTITYSLQYAHLQSDGFSTAHDKTGTKQFDNDDFNQNVLGANITFSPVKNYQLRLFGQIGNYKAAIDDGAFTDDKNYTLKNSNGQFGLANTYNFNKNKGNLHVNINVNNTTRKLSDLKNIPLDTLDYDPYTGLFKGTSLFAEAFANFNLHKHVGLLAGVDVRKQKATIETTYGKLSDDSLQAKQANVYASVFLKNIMGFNVETGARLTHHSVFGKAITFSFNPSFVINKQVKLFANIASGFRAPSLYNLGSEYGNKSLKPEKTMSYEGGIQYISQKNTANIRVTLFRRVIKDLIVFTSLYVPPYGKYNNADKQNGHGLEIEATLKPIQQLTITANYSYVDGKIKTLSPTTAKDTCYFNLYRIPKNTFNVSIGYQTGKKVFTSLGLRALSKKYDLFFNSNTYETEKKQINAYYTIDAYAAYQIKSFIKLFVDLRNITHQQYFDTYGYNTRRFNFMLGATVNF